MIARGCDCDSRADARAGASSHDDSMRTRRDAAADSRRDAGVMLGWPHGSDQRRADAVRLTDGARRCRSSRSVDRAAGPTAAGAPAKASCVRLPCWPTRASSCTKARSAWPEPACEDGLGQGGARLFYAVRCADASTWHAAGACEMYRHLRSASRQLSRYAAIVHGLPSNSSTTRLRHLAQNAEAVSALKSTSPNVRPARSRLGDAPAHADSGQVSRPTSQRAGR